MAEMSLWLIQHRTAQMVFNLKVFSEASSIKLLERKEAGKKPTNKNAGAVHHGWKEIKR